MNHIAIVETVNNWNALARELDGVPKRIVPNINSQLRKVWLASDEPEVERVLAEFLGETEALRGLFSDIAGCLDEVGSAYRNFVWLVITFSTALLILFVAMLVFSLIPIGSAPMRASLRLMANAADRILLGLAGVMTTFLGATGKTLFDLGRRDFQLNHILPTGASAIDFKQVAIDVDRTPTLDKFGNGKSLLEKTRGFEWTAPKQDVPLPYGQ